MQPAAATIAATIALTERADDGQAPPPPRFSVLMATWNQCAYVEDALSSVAAQTCDDYEVVVVDDGSTDDTAAVLSRWAEEFRRRHRNRVAVVTTPNSGQSAAFERGFASCRGAYVCLLDSDDRWLPSKLAEVARAVAEQPQAGMIVHPLWVIDEEGGRTGSLRPRRARLSEGDLRAQVTRTGRHVAPPSSGVVIRSDVFRRLLPMPTSRFRSGADAYLTFGASLVAPVHAIAEALGEYRQQPESHYLHRMLTPDGLERSVALQRAIVRPFGLEHVVERNSYFARNIFALAKFRGTARARLAAFARLARATLTDDAFSARQRLALTGYWTLCLVAPRWLFGRLWRAFQMRQAGYAAVRRRSGGDDRGTGRGKPAGAGAAERAGRPGLPPSYSLLGATVTPLTVAGLCEIVENAIATGRRCAVGHHNLHSLALLRGDAKLREYYARTTCSFIDGMSIVLLGRLLGLPLRRGDRMTSIDWLRPMLREAAARRWRVFVLGSKPGVAQSAAEILRADIPGLQIESAHGYFDPAPDGPENLALLARLAEYRPQVLMVGMGVPRQEHWIADQWDRIPANCVMNLGAFLDYVTGAAAIPPRWMARLGLEWLGRLGSEPRRLWRRYLVEPWGLFPALVREMVARRMGRGPGRRAA